MTTTRVIRGRANGVEKVGAYGVLPVISGIYMLVYIMSGRFNANLGGTAEVSKLLSLFFRDKGFFYLLFYRYFSMKQEDVQVYHVLH